MTLPNFLSLLLVTMLITSGCSSTSVPGSPGVPEPICVLENPATGERARLYKEIVFKVPADYDEQKHIANWTAEKKENGFTKQISPKDDRKQLAELQKKNLAASRQGANQE